MTDTPPIDQDLKQQFDQLSQEQGLSQEQANKLENLYTEYCQKHHQNSLNAQQESLQQTEKILRQEWQNSLPAKLQAAHKAIDILGGQNALKDLQNIGAVSQEGYLANPTIAKMLVAIGELSPHQPLVKGNSQSSSKDEISQRWADPDFQKKLLNDAHPEHSQAVQKLHNLYKSL